MRNILAIARKELSIYFTTPWAYVVFTAMVAVTGFFFLASLEYFAKVQVEARQIGWEQLGPGAARYRNLTDGVIVPLWQTTLVITLFVAPLISMRLFAEEKRNKTFELLMTAPLRPTEIVLGKYLGGVGVMTATLGLTLVFPLVVSAFGSGESGTALEWTTVLLGYVGMLLWGATCLAVGMFISSLTESQMLAAFLTFVVLLVWWLLENVVAGSPEPLRSIAMHLSFGAQLEGIMSGLLQLKAILFFLSVNAFVLLLTQRRVEAERWG